MLKCINKFESSFFEEICIIFAVSSKCVKAIKVQVFGQRVSEIRAYKHGKV